MAQRLVRPAAVPRRAATPSEAPEHRDSGLGTAATAVVAAHRAQAQEVPVLPVRAGRRALPRAGRRALAVGMLELGRPEVGAQAVREPEERARVETRPVARVAAPARLAI